MPASTPNLFLRSLSAQSRDQLLGHCTAVDLPLRKNLYEAHTVPSHAYFITSGIASVVTEMSDGATAEVGLIGREGFSGSFHLLGPTRVSTTCFIQWSATGLKIPFPELSRAFRTNQEIRDRVLECVQEQVVTLAQLAGCNRLHEAEKRLSRWLLMAQDRTQSDVLEFTQEFLAMMLGARRSTVTVVASELQRKGLIEYQRGKLKILSREDLEATACHCYQLTKHVYSTLYTQPLPEHGVAV